MQDKFNNFTEFWEEKEQEALLLLKRLVEINSHSKNISGIERCLEIFSREIPALFEIERREGILLCGSPKGKSSGYVLLMGHMDTVFPSTTSFTDLVIQGDRIRGPGVYDMKGGLVIALYALKYLEFIGKLSSLPVVFMINSDEEIGSPSSKKTIMEYGKDALCGLVFEGGGINGEIVSGRKGKLGYKICTYGRAGHAGFVVKDKASAILEMAYKVMEIEGLNSPGDGVCVNVGRIEGGVAPNIVPDRCEIAVDIRFAQSFQMESLRRRIGEMVSTCRVKGVRSEAVEVSSRPCMEREKNQELCNLAREVALSLGQDISCEMRGGVSDANFISHVGTPVIDGLGPVGGEDHSEREYIYAASIPLRVHLTAELILACCDFFQRQ